MFGGKNMKTRIKVLSPVVESGGVEQQDAQQQDAQQQGPASGRRPDLKGNRLVRRALRFAEIESLIVRQERALRWGTWDVPDADRRLRIVMGGLARNRRAQLVRSARLAAARRARVSSAVR